MFHDDCPGSSRERWRYAPLRLLPLLLLVSTLNAWSQSSDAEYAEPTAPPPPAFRLDLGLTTDSNVSRSYLSGERLSDQLFSLHLGRDKVIGMGSNSQLVLGGFAGLEHYRRYSGLGKAYLGAEAELQYRPSADFDAPTWGLKATATAEEFRSEMRDGLRLSIAANVRMALTDRIHLFAAIARNLRVASNPVFDTRDNSIRFLLDYALAPRQTLYLGGEYRRGDIVSSGVASATSSYAYRARALDDVFTQAGYTSYRSSGRTLLFTLGLNWALGEKDSLDLSWRPIRSYPKYQPSAALGGPIHYLSNQFSLVYLKSF